MSEPAGGRTDARQPPERGRFIVVEGIDGSGSTTQAKQLAAALGQRSIAAVATHEPSDGPVGQLIREVLERRRPFPGDAPDAQHPARTWIPDWACMAQLFAADRLDHLSRAVEPALERGVWVVSDRYVLSSLAYQSLTSPGGQANLPWLRELNRFARVPDLTIVLRVSAQTAAARRQVRGGEPELYEENDLQRRLAAAYAGAAELLSREHMPVAVDAEQSQQRVFEAVWQTVQQHFGLR
jgi:dTMP kinase